MQPPLPRSHAECKQRRQQQCAEQRIERSVPSQLTAQRPQYIVSRAEGKAGQHRGRQLRKLERYRKLHLSEQLLPEAA